MRFASLSLLGSALLLACSTTTTGTAADAGAGARPSCEMLAEHCHGATSEEGQKCHELGESEATEATCKASADRCMAACPQSDAGLDTSSPDAASDGSTGEASTCKAVGTECADSSECCSKDCHAHSGTMKMCE